MSISRFIAAATLPLVLSSTPLMATAQLNAATVAQAASAPSPDQVKAAVKKALMSVNLTPAQKSEIKPMMRSYQSQAANADPATKKAAQETLMKNIYGVLTPAQQDQFKASMKESLGTPP